MDGSNLQSLENVSKGYFYFFPIEFWESAKGIPHDQS